MILRRGFHWRRMAVLTLCALAAGAGGAARAEPVDLGVFSLVTGPTGGVDFEIDNYTGGFALPDYGFPAVTPVTFTELTLTYYVGGVEEVLAVPDAGPGTTMADPLLPGSAVIDSASLSGVLAPATFQQSDGSSWQFPTDILFVDLQPSSGTELTPDVDFTIITAEADVPEPATAVLVLAGLALLGLLRRR